MGFRVTRASALFVGLIAALPLVGLSSAGFSRNADWEGQELAVLSGVGIYGPQPISEFVGNTSHQVLERGGTHNLELAEDAFRYTPDFDLASLEKPVKDEGEEIQSTVLRIAYAQFLVSMTAAQDAMTDRPDEVEAIDSQVAQNSSLLISDAGTPEDFKPDFNDVVAPIPHERRVSVVTAQLPVVKDESSYRSVPIEVALQDRKSDVSPPQPAPIALRPISVVRPKNVRIVQAARDVSVDRMVHVRAPGSWPRRLDTIRSANTGNIFMQNWGGNRTQTNRAVIRLPSGFMMVVGNN